MIKYFLSVTLCMICFMSFGQVTNQDWVERDGKVYLRSNLTKEQVLAEKFYQQSDYRYLAEVYPNSSEAEKEIKVMAIEIIDFMKPELIRDIVFEAINLFTGFDLRCKKKLEQFHLELGKSMHEEALRTAGFDDKYIKMIIE